MANTFTTNYSLTKSEIGANNDNWGSDLNDALSSVDSQIVRKVDKTDLVTQTSNKIAFSGNSLVGNSSSASTIFQNFQAGDIISIAGSSNSGNNGNHLISSKTNAYTLVTSTTFTNESEGATLSYHLVPKYSEVDIDGGTIDGATIATSDITVGSGKTLDVSSGTLTLGSNKITTASIIDDNVTYAKIQNVSADERILGRVSGADGPIEELTQAQVKTFIGDATTSASGLMSGSDKTAVDGQGMRHLLNVSADNSSTTLDINLSSYSYDHYKIIIKHLAPATDNASFSIILGTSSSSFATTSGYFMVGRHLTWNSNGLNSDDKFNKTDVIASATTIGSGSAGGVHGELNLFDLHSTSYYTTAEFTATEYDVTDGDINRLNQSCARTSATNDAYVRISCNSGNIKQGKVSVYAILN